MRKRAISPSIPPPGPYSLSVSFQQAPGHVYAGERSADKEDTNIHTHTHKHTDTKTHTHTQTHTHTHTPSSARARAIHATDLQAGLKEQKKHVQKIHQQNTFSCKSASHSCDGFTGRMAADAGAGSHREMAKRPCESTRTFPRTLESQCPSTLLYKVAVESTGKWRSGNSHGHPHLSALLHQRRRRHGLHLYMYMHVCECVYVCAWVCNGAQPSAGVRQSRRLSYSIYIYSIYKEGF